MILHLLVNVPIIQRIHGHRKRKVKIYEKDISFGPNVNVIPYDKFSASICGEIQARTEKYGKPLSNYDSQIAATDNANGMVLVIHNIADFEQMKENVFLRLEDWFTA